MIREMCPVMSATEPTQEPDLTHFVHCLCLVLARVDAKNKNGVAWRRGRGVAQHCVTVLNRFLLRPSRTRERDGTLRKGIRRSILLDPIRRKQGQAARMNANARILARPKFLLFPRTHHPEWSSSGSTSYAPTSLSMIWEITRFFGTFASAQPGGNVFCTPGLSLASGLA